MNNDTNRWLADVLQRLIAANEDRDDAILAAKRAVAMVRDVDRTMSELQRAAQDYYAALNNIGSADTTAFVKAVSYERTVLQAAAEYGKACAAVEKIEEEM